MTLALFGGLAGLGWLLSVWVAYDRGRRDAYKDALDLIEKRAAELRDRARNTDPGDW